MKTWNRTLFDWDDLRACGVETDIPVTDWPERINEKLWHKIHGMRIFSLRRQARAALEFDIFRGMIGATDQRSEIVKRLKEICNRQRNVYIHEEKYGQTIFGSFDLFRGESFCEAALDVALAIFTDFGVKQPRGYSLSCFTLSQQTFVRHDGKWIDLACYLRMTHGLFSRGTDTEAEIDHRCLPPVSPKVKV